MRCQEFSREDASRRVGGQRRTSHSRGWKKQEAARTGGGKDGITKVFMLERIKQMMNRGGPVLLIPLADGWNAPGPKRKSRDNNKIYRGTLEMLSLTCVSLVYVAFVTTVFIPILLNFTKRAIRDKVTLLAEVVFAKLAEY